ncbi:MmgE/PrpD family protein [Mycobacterium sp. ITM-2016-00317]|uniref:MmgE/PrpD family protein n=1 Tax=Mycobacterium sp. ITM-2016-00317 TaxID=2099694 RepID=UPI00287FB625|nr:MmgE/PrpD family protein [Mycobacterium sp. ITM-2016-00317]WNG86337.1 MmgE/PrpD family protein [Mycobacterium sp. ITM-2016-00317]
MTYIDEIVAFIETADPRSDSQSPQRWDAVREAVAVAAEHTQETDTSLAYAVGCRVADNIAAVIDSAESADGWSRRSVAGAIGAGAAVGRLFGFDHVKLRHLLGLCATQATGLRSLEDTETGTLQVSKAAADAVEAALLVSNGFTSSADGLTGRRGLFALMAPGVATPSTFDGGTRSEEVHHGK